MSSFFLFVYGTLRRDGGAAGVLEGATFLEPAEVGGVLYDIEGRHPALMLYGDARVRGEIWTCPADLLPRLDAFEGVEEGLFRRIGVEIDGRPCWTYVAGPAIARHLTPDRRIRAGDWLARNER